MARADESKTEQDPRWLPILAGLLVMIGGVVIPILGTIAGLVLMWLSETWTRREKWVATLTPVLLIVVLVGFGAVSSLWQAQQGEPVGGEIPNPLIPAPVDLVTSGVLLVLVVQTGVGIWLLVRAKRAWSIAESQRLAS